MKRQSFRRPIVLVAALMFISIIAFAQRPIRVGTTSANFLEIGYGSAGSALGDAYVSMVKDASAIYWNPAGLAQLEGSEVSFTLQPWIVGMNTTFGAAGIVVPGFGTIGAGIIMMDYGEMDVTTMEYQEGTGEKFSAKDLAISISYARNLAEWFSFGASGKMVNTTIWHENASAFAFDLGVLIKTDFFSPSEGHEHGLRIGMSISNYGTSLKYEGSDLLSPIDVDPNAAGNYQSAPGRLSTQEWELPLIFRIGASVTPLVTDMHEIALSVDALHPNNNNESVNVGAQYTATFPSFGKVFLRGGYKGIFMEDAQYGATFGVGLQVNWMANQGVRVEYAYRDIGIFGGIQAVTVGVTF